ncbi:MAG TPA: aminotransferase class V-fold PLP-dependent enzyme [Microthrixaceae bacterium]|nr:aminotransferase class V-fold PLP-dependent enzyme [Microthrixaceae bacterium]
MAEHPFPIDGRSGDDIIAELSELRAGDIDWRSGRAFSLVYNSDDADLERLLHAVGDMFLHENALNPFRYRTLLKMEVELVAMARDLFGAAAGSTSSGGTESIFLAVQSARDHARTRGITSPNLVCTDTAHPAFAKACHYLGVEMRRLPHGIDGRAVPERYAETIDAQTALVVASSPCYPFGVIDPIADIAAIASAADVLCHVDACLGGWVLPWWERLGEPVPPWDFRVPGVTSLSADIHKYGYTFKGASVVLYRDREVYEQQVFMYDDWPGGLYASSTSAGTRPGAPIAGAWAAVTHLGEAGYMRLARRVLDATRRFQRGIEAIDGLHITFPPDLSLFEFGSDRYDMNAVCDVMDERGWNLDRQQGGLHLMVAPGHDRVVDDFCTDLASAVADHGTARPGLHVYGGVADDAGGER